MANKWEGKRKPGRSAWISPNKIRNRTLRCAVNSEESAEICREAKLRGLSVSAYIRSNALQRNDKKGA